jgi:hypothetical protein
MEDFKSFAREYLKLRPRKNKKQARKKYDLARKYLLWNLRNLDEEAEIYKAKMRTSTP